MSSKPLIIYFLLCLLFILSSSMARSQQESSLTFQKGAIVRGDSSRKQLALVFTGDEYGDGLDRICRTVKKQKVSASFFFTGRFYRNPQFRSSIVKLKKYNHYLGPHSDEHLLYCDWQKRDSLLVTKDSFTLELTKNVEAMRSLGIPVHHPQYFIPPYEWWNDSVATWCSEMGWRLTSFTPGIRTNADYTYPQLGNAYKSTDRIMLWLKDLIDTTPAKLNGAIMLIHAGTDPRRKDKLYDRLEEIILLLKKSGYQLKRIDELLSGQ